MPSYAQLTACDPHAFIEAGQTYQRMASGFGVVPEKVREVGRQVVQVSQDVGSIVSSGAATIQLAGSGNAGFLATPAMAALTASHLAALKNLGGSAQTYEAVDRDQQNAAITAHVPTDTTWSAR